jgi:hypothetical protein
MRRFGISLVLFGALVFGAKQASAADYICAANFLPGPSVAGSYGDVSFSLYTQPDCQGSYLGFYTLCSVGATYSLCANSAPYLGVNAEEMAVIANTVSQAAGLNFPVSVQTTSCINPASSNCAGFVLYN